MSNDRGAPPWVRGVIEGFYGKPFSHQERIELLRFLGRHGFDCYVYAPKDDPRHREHWRDPYAADELSRFRELAGEAERHGIRFLYALAPGLTYDASQPDDFVLLEAKIRAVIEAGARGIALLFDDLTGDSTTLDPQLQASVIRRVYDLVTAIDDRLAFWFIGNFYCGDAAEIRGEGGFWRALYGRSALEYFAAYAQHVPASVPMLWTGPAVFSARVTEGDMKEICAMVGRPVILWDNFPVNDTLRDQLFVGPYVGRDPGIAGVLHGVVLNLMSQAAANQIPLATAAEFLSDGERYDPERALERAIEAASPSPGAARHLATFVAQHRGHPVLAGSDTAQELAALTTAAFAADDLDPQRVAALRFHLEQLRDNEAHLTAAFTDAPLLAEIAPWSRQMGRLARAALAGLDVLAGDASRDGFVSLRDESRAADHLVAATRLPGALQPFVAGAGETVDRFAELFAAIESRLEPARRW
ncbi:beta-N-acetylglucosaminidase domain-containing protein [Candidatus Binatia bacterium]|nr:beta-N-acetylglucosaminidase domain-containing protein [Candidatus Binatia bacterium]